MATTTDSAATSAATDSAAIDSSQTTAVSSSTTATASTTSSTTTTVESAGAVLPVIFRDQKFLSRVLIMDDGRTLMVARSKVTAYDQAAYEFLAARSDFAKQ